MLAEPASPSPSWLDPDQGAELEAYKAVRRRPELWEFQLAWLTARGKMEACAAGHTAWLVGSSAVTGGAAAVRAGCGMRGCERCSRVRAAFIRKRIDELMDARPCVMFTLTLQQRKLSKLQAWRIIQDAWRRCWERLCRRLPWLLTEPVLGCERLLQKRERERRKPIPGPAPYVELSTEKKALDFQPRRRRVPQAWVIESHKSGYPHMHVAVAVPRFFEIHPKDGYHVLAEEWKRAVLWVTKGLSAGGYVFISPPPPGAASPGRYLAKYVTKERDTPLDVLALLWGEQIRTFGATGRKRKLWTETELQEEWERSTWVWALVTAAEGNSADARARGALDRAVLAGARVEPWSELHIMDLPSKRQVMQIGDESYTFTWGMDRKLGEMAWVNREAPRLPD